MRIRSCTFVSGVLAAILLGVFSFVLGSDKVTPPPPTEVKVAVDTVHGVIIEDPYRWLEDQESAETRAWIDAQNNYTQSFYSNFPNQSKVKSRLAELMKIDKIRMPIEQGGRYFIEKRAADQEQFILYMRESLDGEDKVLIDPHNLSAENNVSVGVFDISLDGKILAYAQREGGQDETAVHFLDIDNGYNLSDSLPRGLYWGISIDAEKNGFYYVKTDSTGGRVFYHRFGADFDTDSLIFGGQYDPSVFVGASLSEDRRYLNLGVYYGSGGKKSEIHVMHVANNGPVVPIMTEFDAAFYGAMVGDKMYIMTNYQAPNWCLYRADLADPAFDNWELIVPESESVMSYYSPAGGRLYVSYLENVSSIVKIFDADGKYLEDLKLPTLGSVSGVWGHWDGEEAFYSFSSFHIPQDIYRLDLTTDEAALWARVEIPIETDNIKVEQVWYESKDGTRVPMFVVYRDGVALDGSTHTLLTGYGGFNIAKSPEFRDFYAYWVETGGILAIPSLRGGGEFGETWHEAAMFEKKQNSFDDFIAAAEWLIENRYTSTEKLAIRGGSNGGLLMGAVSNQRPELFKAVVCTYPLLDMVRYHKFLMGPYWVSEYGSADSPDQFEYIYKYSPYHNVNEEAKYPATLFVTGDNDTRVAPLHARKMTALLQARKGLESPILLWYDTKAGHSAGTSVSSDLEEVATQLGFLFWQLGVNP